MMTARVGQLIDYGHLQPSQNPARGKFLLLCGYLLYVILSAILIISFILYKKHDNTTIYAAQLLVSIILLVPAVRIVQNGRRHLSKCYDDVLNCAVLRHTWQQPVLYLRSFAADGRTALLHGRTAPVRLKWLWLRGKNSYEELLAYAFRKIGPLVAIGRPDDQLPALGALREYVDDDTWKDRVMQLATKCQTVVFQIGLSDSLHWEIEHVRHIVAPEKLLLLVPLLSSATPQPRRRGWAMAAVIAIPGVARLVRYRRRSQSEHLRKEMYLGFVAKAGPLFPHALPDNLGQSQLIRFETDWRPRIVSAQPQFLIPRSWYFWRTKCHASGFNVAIEFLANATRNSTAFEHARDILYDYFRLLLSLLITVIILPLALITVILVLVFWTVTLVLALWTSPFVWLAYLLLTLTRT